MVEGTGDPPPPQVQAEPAWNSSGLQRSFEHVGGIQGCPDGSEDTLDIVTQTSTQEDTEDDDNLKTVTIRGSLSHQVIKNSRSGSLI